VKPETHPCINQPRKEGAPGPGGLERKGKIENDEREEFGAESFDTADPRAYTGVMEIELTPELQAKLERIASQQGRDTKSLVHEAVERLIGYDEWFIRQVETGLAQADRGELLEHEEVVARMEDLISRKQRQP
jgi:predicted transcriptional regulator